MTRKSRLAITERALIQRLNRKLAADRPTPSEQGPWLCVKKARGERLRQEVGDYYLLDLRHNFIAEKDLDLEEMGREYEVLKAWEILGEL